MPQASILLVLGISIGAVVLIVAILSGTFALTVPAAPDRRAAVRDPAGRGPAVRTDQSVLGADVGRWV